jgi:Kdo2-lipid IVA lauroyltransferase/acyltransferase
MSANALAKMPLASRLRYRAEAVGFFTLMWLFRLLGLDLGSALGGFIGRNIYYRLPPANRARENLKLAFPQKSAAEIEAMVLAMCDNLGRTVGEYPNLDKISIAGPDPRITVSGAELPAAAISSGKPMIFFSGHIANWEMMAIGSFQAGFPGGTVYRPPNNPFVDDWIAKQRAKCGSKELIAKGSQGVKRMFTFLRRNMPIYMLVDQKTNEGLSAPFFGREAMTTPAPAALALRLNATLMPISLRRTGGARFHMQYHPPLAFQPSGDHEADILALTIRINAEVERMIRVEPSQWLWVHRRWPTDRDRMTNRRNAQDLGGTGVRVEREGSSLT